jgi:signal transduction histidine kinase
LTGLRSGLADEPWLAFLLASRLVATAFAAALIAWGGMSGPEALMLLYGPLSTAAIAGWPRLRRMPQAWAFDFSVTLAFILASGDWRSPFYLLWLSSLALPATSLPLPNASYLAVAATFAFLAVAFIGGPAWNALQVSSTETLAIHLALPLLLTGSLAYAANALRRLGNERAQRERLAIEAERRRIAWELHDSAKQRLHAAHLLVSSLQGRVREELEATVGRASVELESAASDMDTSLAELRSPLEGRPLDEALRERAIELAPDPGPAVTVAGKAPPLSPLVSAHVYRIGVEAITNALRHADATRIDVRLESGDGRLRLRVADDGQGVLDTNCRHGTGLVAMENRAATIGARLDVESSAGQGTVIDLHVPITDTGGIT